MTLRNCSHILDQLSDIEKNIKEVEERLITSHPNDAKQIESLLKEILEASFSKIDFLK